MFNLILSFFYTLGRFALGLLLHPYQSMQLLAEHKMFIWLTLLPTAALGFLTVLIRLLFLVLSYFDLTRVYLQLLTRQLSGVYPIVTTFIIIFCIYWQLMLFYLLLRFQKLHSQD